MAARRVEREPRSPYARDGWQPADPIVVLAMEDCSASRTNSACPSCTKASAIAAQSSDLPDNGRRACGIDGSCRAGNGLDRSWWSAHARSCAA